MASEQAALRRPAASPCPQARPPTLIPSQLRAAPPGRSPRGGGIEEGTFLVDPPHTRHSGAAPGMRALGTGRRAWPGLLPGLMRLAGAASMIPTSPPLRAAEVGITPALL